jgi:hypothetical protein
MNDFQVRLNLVVESVQTSTDLKEGHYVPLFLIFIIKPNSESTIISNMVVT